MNIVREHCPRTVPKNSSSNGAQHNAVCYWTALSRMQVARAVRVVALCRAPKVVQSRALGLLLPVQRMRHTHSVAHSRLYRCAPRSCTVATWEIPYSGILCRDIEFFIATESLEKSVAIENLCLDRTL